MQAVSIPAVGHARHPWRICCALVAAVILWPASSNAQPNAGRGLRIMQTVSEGNCLACHHWPGLAGTPSSFGPNLSGVASRYSTDELVQWVHDARQRKPDTLMPPFGTTTNTHESVRAEPQLSAAQIADVVAALQAFR